MSTRMHLASILILGLIGVLWLAPGAAAQAGLCTGSIQGTILDPHGVSVPNAKVTITSKATETKLTPEVTGAGAYNSGPLLPGDYIVRVEASGFRTVEEIQDGGNFDPTKKGFSSISFRGRFGRTARIEVDGLDISDETVGTAKHVQGLRLLRLANGQTPEH